MIIYVQTLRYLSLIMAYGKFINFNKKSALLN